MRKQELLAPIQSIMQESPDPGRFYTYSPGICALPGGRIIGTMDMGGPGMKEMDGVVGFRPSLREYVQGRIFLSDDGGDSWRHVHDFPFLHARPFYAGGKVYVMGQLDDLYIIVSEDQGETWSAPHRLTWQERWGGAPTNVYYHKGYIYFPFEKRRNLHLDKFVWDTANSSPMLLRGKVTDDLTKRENWTFSEEFYFCDHVDMEKTDYWGLPFYHEERFRMVKVNTVGNQNRSAAPVGWMESNVVRITDPDHIWFDPSGHTFHVFLRCASGRTNLGAMLKMTELPDGSIVPEMVKTPGGNNWLFLPLPGGQMRFHMVQDDQTGLYWLISTQSQDSMIHPDKMPDNRYSLPDNERRCLQLHFSRNCVDWCFAGLIDRGATELESRSYASACIRGDDLLVLSRSGDHRAASAHNGNLITLHTVKNFRELAY